MSKNFFHEFVVSRSAWLLFILPVAFLAVIALTSIAGLFILGIGYGHVLGDLAFDILLVVLPGGYLLMCLILIVLSVRNAVTRMAQRQPDGLASFLIALVVAAMLTGEVYAIWWVGSHM